MDKPASMYKRHRFPAEIIQHTVWLYHRFNLSTRDIEDLMAERVISRLTGAVPRQNDDVWMGAYRRRGA